MNSKEFLLTIAASISTVVASMFGGWDYGVQTLLFCMVIDYVTGMIVAGVFQNSAKTGDGGLNSQVGFAGLCKKVAGLFLVIIGVRLDGMVGGTYTRTAIIFFLVGNEGLSILENLGLMGVEYPEFIAKALSVLQDQGNKGEE